MQWSGALEQVTRLDPWARVFPAPAPARKFDDQLPNATNEVWRKGQIRFTAVASHVAAWMLQVSAPGGPGLLARLTGRPAPDRSPVIYELARTVSGSLAELGFTGIVWRWDGPPRGGDPADPPAPA